MVWAVDSAENRNITMKHGYELTADLRDDAEDCPNPARARLLHEAADEIESLIAEVRKLEKRLKSETKQP
jgi:hypothetical protein